MTSLSKPLTAFLGNGHRVLRYELYDDAGNLTFTSGRAGLQLDRDLADAGGIGSVTEPKVSLYNRSDGAGPSPGRSCSAIGVVDWCGHRIGIDGSPFRHGWRGVVRLNLSRRFGGRGSVGSWISLGRRGLRSGWSSLGSDRRRCRVRSVGKGGGRCWRILDLARLARVQVIRFGGARGRSGQHFDVDDDLSALAAAAWTRQGDQHGKDHRDAEPMHGSGAKQAKWQGDGSSRRLQSGRAGQIFRPLSPLN